ncbi:MAG: hypothetical protein WBA23_24230 [Tunicatimonas sp.]|uniref:hypothetical protein n=1 Tax=Tunicatimonas sp. TaxID=1940096 RepID=UPI003C739F4C
MLTYYKRSLVFALFFIVHIQLLYGQKGEIYRINTGQKINEALPMEVKYRYETFQTGTVLFYNGKTSTGKLNYNILLGDMQFVDRSRDTLSLANRETIKHVKINNDLFFYDEKHGYMEVVEEYPSVKLAVHQQFVPIAREKSGGFGQSTGTSAVREYGSVNSGSGGINQLEMKGDVLVTQKANYLLIDKNQRARRANRSGILRAFSKGKKRNQYLSERS